jgi:cytidine deaminase
MTKKIQKLSIISEFEVYENDLALPDEEIALLDKARAAMLNAYAPYSNFHVGAAVLLYSGEIVIGSNQENAAYPSGLCAERVAVYQTGAQYPGSPIKAIAVTCKTKERIIDIPVTPCGACRQAIAEYESRYNRPIKIIMAGETGQIYVANSIESLLPLSFNRKHLK